MKSPLLLSCLALTTVAACPLRAATPTYSPDGAYLVLQAEQGTSKQKNPSPTPNSPTRPPAPKPCEPRTRPNYLLM